MAKSGHPWLAERFRENLVVKCQLKAKSGHPWLAERFREHLVVKCQLMAKSGHPWLAERRKGDLGVRSNPNPNKRNVVRRKGDLVVKGLFECEERPSFACGTS